MILSDAPAAVDTAQQCETRNPPRQLPWRRLRLFSPVRGIDNILLADELQQELHMSCQLISDPRLLAEPVPGPGAPAAADVDLLREADRPSPPPTLQPVRRPERDVVLFDSREISAVELQSLLVLIPAETSCGLLNLTRNCDHERLIEWPQIKGMFYHNSGLQQLFNGVQAMLKGELWLPRHLCHAFLYRRRAPSHALITSLSSKLTRREREALEGLYAGKNNSALASQLKLSEHTIKSHLYSAYKKIGVKSRLEASNWLRDHYPLLDQLSSR